GITQEALAFSDRQFEAVAQSDILRDIKAQGRLLPGVVAAYTRVLRPTKTPRPCIRDQKPHSRSETLFKLGLQGIIPGGGVLRPPGHGAEQRKWTARLNGSGAGW